MSLDITAECFDDAFREAVDYSPASARKTADHIAGRVEALMKSIVGRSIKGFVVEYLEKFEAQLNEERMAEHVDLIMGEAWKLIVSAESVRGIKLAKITLNRNLRYGLSEQEWESAERLVRNIIEKLQRLSTLEKIAFDKFKLKFIGRLKKAKLTDDQAGVVAAMVWDARKTILQ